MHTKLIVAICTLVYFVQVNFAQTDPKLIQCRDKLMQQASKIDFSKLPSCFNADKLQEAKNHTQIFGDFYNSLPDKCKHPGPSSIKECLQTVNQFLSNNTAKVQTSIIGSINALFEGGKGCLDIIVHQFSHLDEYIAKGCP